MMRKRNRKILEAIRADTVRASVSRDVARKTLIKEGIYKKNGKLRKEFGG